MAETFLPIKSVKQYLREFGYEAIVKNHQSKDLVRAQLIDQFKKEIFGQLAIHVGDPQMLAKPVEEIDQETMDKVNNILSNSIRKWKRLCVVFQKYAETANTIFPSDLMINLEDVVKGLTEPEDPEAQDAVLLDEDKVQ